jgi:2-polyprenyl-6-methoxyphenol hydroxylase-like FAD-dependent oxidoreductase/predicted DsbA family dithiol-disulfide isomerase
MKTVIIGGGIAGMAIGSFLRRKGMEIVICEKQPGNCEKGHAFLMHSEALSILNDLNGGRDTLLPGKMVGRFNLRRPDGKEVSNVALDSWRCIKRNDLVSFLVALQPPGSIKNGRSFSHFIRQGDKVVAAVFSNGEVEYGDLFIGADGGNSRVREEIFGKILLTPVAVKEIVGISSNRKLAEIYGNMFVKFQDAERGLAFGMIPTCADEFVWFMQYDPSIDDLSGNDPEEIRGFCHNMLKAFPDMVGEVLGSNDFSKTYIWSTKDFDLLPSFHHKNVVLLGDAAHLTLPFTSAGTTNAMIGAKTLSECLADNPDPETAFGKYYQSRAGTIREHILLGRELKSRFLHPKKQNGSGILLPFIDPAGNGKKAIRQRLRVQYFTDPICSTCWIIQPLLKKMNLEYGNYLDIQYYMGGLLPSWSDCKGKIQCPSDAAEHWEEVGVTYEMPLDGDVWIEDPLSSSFPPSIAFKAAQLQDRDKAVLYLRRIREMVFLEKKNIMKWAFLESAAVDAGLDPVRLRSDYKYDARLAFEEDLELARRLDITGFPTLIFSNGAGRSITLKGYQPYAKIENVILELLPSAKKDEIDREPKSLFGNFPTMVDQEFALLSNLVHRDALKVLQELSRKGYIQQQASKNGNLWRRNR